LDILIHAMVPKREMYRVCNQRRLAAEEDVDSILFSVDKCLPQHVDKFHRPYWYIGNPGAGKYNTNQFMFMFGTHTPLETSQLYAETIHNCADADGCASQINLSDELTPMYSQQGIIRQYRAHYSSVDMEMLNPNTLAWHEDFDHSTSLRNTIPFQLQHGMVYNEEISALHIAEGSFRRESADVEFMF